jgi:hypothetical protein
MYHSFMLDRNPITVSLNYYSIEHITSVQSNNNEAIFELYEVVDLPSGIRSGGFTQPFVG